MEFNIKNIEVRDPDSLFSELDKLVRFGDVHATVKGERDGVEGYYLAGLLVNDIKRSSVSSETIADLNSALKSSEISYAILPNDVRQGQIPLVLDDHSRSYLRNNLRELIEYESLSWRLFFIPIKNNVSDYQLFNAEIIYDDVEEDEEIRYLALSYNDINDTLLKMANDNNEQIDLSYLYQQDNENKESDDVTVEKNENVKTETVSSSKFVDNIDFDDESDEVDVSKNELEIDNTPTEYEINDASVNENVANGDKSGIEENESITEESDEEDNIEANNSFEITNEYTMIPQELESILDNFTLRRFEEYDNLDKTDATHNAILKEVKNANNVLEELEQNVIRKSKELFFEYMDQSYRKINQAINVDTGDEIVKSKHKEAIEQKEQLEDELLSSIESYKQKLEDKFWNEDFNAYKERILAGLKIDFEKEEYYNLVAEPLERFKENEKNRIEEQKYEVTHNLSNWFDYVRKSAIMEDRNNAIAEVQKYLDSSMQKVQPEILKLDQKLKDQNERYIQYEYSKQAEERLRETVGSDLYTDEQAKQFKKQAELLEEKKNELLEELKNTKVQYQADIDINEDKHNKFKKEIEESHKQILQEKEEELLELTSNLEKLKNENNTTKEKLESTQTKFKKKVISIAAGAFIIPTFIFGGAFMASHNNGKSAQEDLKSQSKIVQQQKDEVSKTKDELEKIKKEKAEEHAKQQKIIEQQKKELDKNKKSKKDKK